MCKQREIVDFIEQTDTPASPRTLFGQIFKILDNPVISCTNCLCQYCVRNVEEMHRTVRAYEASEDPCFNCDDCQAFTGEHMHRERVREDCNKFLLSDHGADRNRKRFKIIEGGKRC